MAAIDVQLVLYHTDLSKVERSLHALSGAATYGNEEGPGIDRLVVKLGDCSAVRTLSNEDLGRWRAIFAPSLEIEYQYFSSNLGRSKAQNQLSAGGVGDYLLFSDPDVVPLPSAVSFLHQTLRDDPRVGIVDAKQLPLELPKYFEPITGLTSWCSDAFAMVRRTDFEAAGGFDEKSFFSYLHDVDLSWRLRLAGLEAVHQPAAVVYLSKRLDQSGAVESTKSDRYQLAEASLVLMWKWGAADQLERTLLAMVEGDDDDDRAASARFAELRECGMLPPVEDNASQVAEFPARGLGKVRW